MRIAICPGSFDPITNGHLDVIRRAARLFSEVIVLVSSNAAKTCLFTPEERKELIRLCIPDLPNVRVDASDRLIADYAHEVGALVIFKGLRAMSDFDYEFQQALTNRKLNSMVETVFVAASGDSMYLSSSMVKQVCSLGGDVSSFVPQAILPILTARCNPRVQG
jgi:pantetheine-phosphate adenylyltransferase